MTIDVARDMDGLQQALSEVIEEDFAFSRVRRVFDLSGDDDRDRLLRSLPPRTLSPGYYKYASYIVWLDERIKAGMQFRRLADCEMEGLVALTRARGKFDYDHPSCACGAHQENRFCTKCHSCGIEFRKRDAA